MIVIKLIPNILKDEGRKTEQFVFDRDKSLRQYLDDSGFDYSGCKIIVSGKKTENLGMRLDKGDEIIITPDVGLMAIPAFISWALHIAWVAATLFWIGVAVTVYSIVTAFTQRKPSTTGSGLDASSPTYDWDGIKTQKAIGVPVAIIYGEHRVGGNIINEYISTQGSNQQFLNMLIGLCEGEVDSISGIEINNNPIANYQGCSSVFKAGTNTQTPIAGFEQLHAGFSTAYTLLKNVDQVYTTQGVGVQGINIYFKFPNGLWADDAGTGSILSNSCTLHIQYRVHGAGAYTDLGSITYTDTQRANEEFVYNIPNLAAGQYDIKVTKTSDDSDFYHTSDVQLVQVDEVTNADLAYPNTALLAVNLLASEQLSGTEPNVTCIVRGKKVLQPQIKNGGATVAWDDYYYDPATSQYKLLADGTVLSWDGTTYITAFSANPVWCFMDLLLSSRYGLGEFIDSSMIDSSLFLEMSRYCENRVPDGLGGYEKRFRMDIVLDSSTKAIDLLLQMATTFNGLIFFSQGLIKLKIDKVDTPVQMFGMGNIISMTQDWSSIKDVPNVIEVQYMDKDKDYTQEQIAVIDEAALAAGDPMRKKQVKCFTTKTSQAIRFGRFLLWSVKYVARSITIKVGIDAIACQCADIINVSHDVPQWGFSGRVVSGTTGSVTLDQPVTLAPAQSYQVMIRHKDDTMETRNVTNQAGTYTVLTVDSNFTTTPAVYEVYAFGPTSKVMKPFRVVSMKRSNDVEVEITAIEYNASVYDDSAVVLPTSNYSSLDLSIPAVTDLKLTERVVKAADGTIQDCIDVWFNKPSLNSIHLNTFQKARIYISDDAGVSWTLAGETADNTFSIIGGIIDGNTYKVAVTTIAYTGQESAVADAPSQSITIIGKSAPPADVTGFLVHQVRDRVYLNWANNTDVDLSGYEIRYGASWDAGEVLASDIKVNNFILLSIQVGGSQNYFIKAIDTSGNYSTNVTQAIITIDNVPFTNIIQSYAEETAWAGTKTHTDKTGNNLEVSTGQLQGTYLTPVRDNGYVATFKIGIQSIATVTGDSTWQDYGDLTFEQVSEALRFLGEEIQGALLFEINTSEDNVTWSGWTAWQAADYKCRYFQIRMTMTRASLSQDLQCSQFDYYADLPDVDDFGTDTVSVAATGKAVVFAKTYHQAPIVNIDILSGSGMVHNFSVIPTTTGFTVKLYDLAGTAQTGNFSWAAHGV
jgi:predicted phage tail protein